MSCERVAQPPPGRDVVLSDFVADANMVGRLVAVLWNEPGGGQTWYVGSVLQSNPADFSLTIKYDDGGTDAICLKETIGEVRWLEGAPLPAAEADELPPPKEAEPELAQANELEPSSQQAE